MQTTLPPELNAEQLAELWADIKKWFNEERPAVTEGGAPRSPRIKTISVSRIERDLGAPNAFYKYFTSYKVPSRASKEYGPPAAGWVRPLVAVLGADFGYCPPSFCWLTRPAGEPAF